jgi:hypothetical protein
MEITEQTASVAAALLGSRKTERKTAAARANIAVINERKKDGVSPETRQRMVESQRARRDREKNSKDSPDNP